MDIFGTKWEFSISFDTSNRELTFKRGFFFGQKYDLFKHRNVSGYCKYRKRVRIFNSIHSCLENWFKALYIFYRRNVHLPFDTKKLKIQNEHIKQVNANIYLLNALTSNYSHFVPILTLRRDNSGIVLRKVRIPTLRNKVRIPTLRRTIPELYRFLLCAEHI